MLETIKELPVVIDLRKSLFEKKFSTHQNVNYFRGVFRSFEEAQKSSPQTKPIGYNNTAAAKLYKERLNRVHSTDYPVLFWMNKYLSEIKTVFDFGGHVGIHFYSYSRVLDFSGIEQWTVCDVESVVTEGRKLASFSNQPKLNFVHNISQGENYDLFLASGSLQYLEWELHDQLNKMQFKPRFVVINMLPLHPVYSTITLQSIGTSFCPYYIRKEQDFIKGMQSAGYELMDAWRNEEKKCNIAFEKARSLDYYKGAVFRLKG